MIKIFNLTLIINKYSVPFNVTEDENHQIYNHIWFVSGCASDLRAWNVSN